MAPADFCFPNNAPHLPLPKSTPDNSAHPFITGLSISTSWTLSLVNSQNISCSHVNAMFSPLVLFIVLLTTHLLLFNLYISTFQFYTFHIVFIFLFIVFFLLPFSPLIPPPTGSHHTDVHVHESFFLFAQPLLSNPLPTPSCQPALNLWVCLYFAC